MNVKRRRGPGSCQWKLRGGGGPEMLPVNVKRWMGVQGVASGS